MISQLRSSQFKRRFGSRSLYTGLQHERSEVRQMSSALLNNIGLSLADALPEARDGQDLSDEATQILFGALDDLQNEASQVC